MPVQPKWPGDAGRLLGQCSVFLGINAILARRL